MFKNITELYKNINIEDDQERRESTLRMAVGFERFVLNYSHQHLSESTPQTNIVFNSLGEWTCQFACSDVRHGKIFNNFIEAFFLCKIPTREKKN